MGYRVKTQRGLQRVVPEEGLGAVRRAIRERNDGVALAMSFDPGTVSDLALYAHASAIMMGLLYARGWRRAQPLTAGGVPRQRGDEPCRADLREAAATPCAGGALGLQRAAPPQDSNGCSRAHGASRCTSRGTELGRRASKWASRTARQCSPRSHV